MKLSFEEIAKGVVKNVKVKKYVVCTTCGGNGAKDKNSLQTCHTCNGSGQVMTSTRTIFGNIQQAIVCSKCNGIGKIPEKMCSVCKGKGTLKTSQKIKLKIPAGIDDGATIRLREHGEAIFNGEKGDLYVHVRVKPHKKFTREGNLILSKEHISMVDAALGVTVEVDTVDGSINMKIPAGTQSGTDFKLSNHGVPYMSGNSRGAQIVTVIVDTPTKLGRKQKAILEDFKNS